MFVFQEKMAMEEAKLKAKYPNISKPGGPSGILAKRLQRGVRSINLLKNNSTQMAMQQLFIHHVKIWTSMSG